VNGNGNGNGKAKIKVKIKVKVTVKGAFLSGERSFSAEVPQRLSFYCFRCQADVGIL